MVMCLYNSHPLYLVEKPHPSCSLMSQPPLDGQDSNPERKSKLT